MKLSSRRNKKGYVKLDSIFGSDLCTQPRICDTHTHTHTHNENNSETNLHVYTHMFITNELKFWAFWEKSRTFNEHSSFCVVFVILIKFSHVCYCFKKYTKMNKKCLETQIRWYFFLGIVPSRRFSPSYVYKTHINMFLLIYAN